MGLIAAAIDAETFGASCLPAVVKKVTVVA